MDDGSYPLKEYMNLWPAEDWRAMQDLMVPARQDGDTSIVVVEYNGTTYSADAGQIGEQIWPKELLIGIHSVPLS